MWGFAKPESSGGLGSNALRRGPDCMLLQRPMVLRNPGQNRLQFKRRFQAPCLTVLVTPHGRHMDGSHAPDSFHSSPNTNNLSIEKGILLELELRANFKFETSRMTDDESGTVNGSSNGSVRTCGVSGRRGVTLTTNIQTSPSLCACVSVYGYLLGHLRPSRGDGPLRVIATCGASASCVRTESSARACSRSRLDAKTAAISE